MKEYRPKVYLAGPITGCDYGGATDWRQYVTERLQNYACGISPMRGKGYLRKEQNIASSYNTPLSCPKGITTRDRWDVQRCDALLANLLAAKRVSIGTVMEIAWADISRHPIILVMEDGNIHESAMLHEVAGFIVPTLDEAIAILRALFEGMH